MGWHRPEEALMICYSNTEEWKRDVLVLRFPLRLWKLEWGNLLRRPSDLWYPGTCVGPDFQPGLAFTECWTQASVTAGCPSGVNSSRPLEFSCNIETRGLRPTGTTARALGMFYLNPGANRRMQMPQCGHSELLLFIVKRWRKLYEHSTIIPALHGRGPVAVF